MLVFLDVGILFSGSRDGSLMSRFLQRLGDVSELCSNGYAIEEARRNLELKFPAHVEAFERLIIRIRCIEGRVSLTGIEIRDKDRPIIEGAAAARCSHLLTSDRRDFGAFFGKVIGGVKVVSPEQLATELADMGLIKRRE